MNPDWVVEYADGKLYFNAGLPEVQKLVADGVAEIVRSYDVDGIGFDADRLCDNNTKKYLIIKTDVDTDEG